MSDPVNNSFFNDYFHPQKLWESKSLLENVEAVGIVLSWATVVIPIIMFVGSVISDYCLKGKVSQENQPGPVSKTQAIGITTLQPKNESSTNTASVKPSVKINDSFEEFDIARKSLSDKQDNIQKALEEQYGNELKKVSDQYSKAKSALRNSKRDFKNAPSSQLELLWGKRVGEAGKKMFGPVQETINSYEKICSVPKNGLGIERLGEIEKRLDEMKVPNITLDFQVKWSELKNVKPDFTEEQFNQLMSSVYSQL